MNRLQLHLLGAALGVVALAGSAAASYVYGTDWSWGPDQAGGYSTSNVVIRVAPGVVPGRADDGRLTLLQPNRPPGSDATEVALAETLQRWGATGIVPAISPPPQNAPLASRLGLDRYYLIHVPQGSNTPALVLELSQAATHIEVAEVDPIAGLLTTPNDPSFGIQYALHNTGQNINGQTGTADADIDAPEAWSLHTGTAAITVAVIDTGVSKSHPDLAGKQVTGRNFTSSDPNDTDDSWLISHGTHCSGIVGANTNNGQGIAGVSWGVRIMPVKVLNWAGSGEETWCANGVTWAADHGAHVASMSWGSTTYSSLIETAVNYAWGQGLVLVAATGNVASDPISYPAKHAVVIAVGATDNRDNLASFTSTGPEMDLAAPGVDVYSCWDTFFNSNTYSFESGTSMACPHVSGLAALVWSANPALTNAQVRQILESTADDKGAAGWDPQFGWGRINALQAVQAALGPPTTPGDMNCDGLVDFDDISPLVLALTGYEAYHAAFPDCNWLNGDINNDGTVDFNDINGFVGLLTRY